MMSIITSGSINLLRDDMIDEYSATRTIIRFIEEKKIVAFIDQEILKIKRSTILS